MPAELAPRVLLVDDEPNILEPVRLLLEDAGLSIAVAESATRALEILEHSEFSLMITDLSMPGMDGMELLERARRTWPGMAVVILTAYGTIETAVDALKKGAVDYLAKPIRPDELVVRVRKVLRQWDMEHELQTLRARVRRGQRATDLIVGESAAIWEVFKQVAMVAKSDVAVVIYGESGTGKELVARAIHREGRRRSAAFVVVNCGALSEELLRSELFGHEKGAFTGAHAVKKGLFEEAEGGTIFLDEIGEISPGIQVQLLRVLQLHEFTRVGGTRTLKADVRVVSATNRDLMAEVKRGAFREDLFYRINVVPIRIPPLRERREDVPLLINHFVNRFRVELDVATKGFTPGAIEAMMDYDWPGNVRELENKVKRLMVMSNQEWIGVESIMLGRPYGFSAGARATVAYHEERERVLESFDRHYLETILRVHNGNISQAARASGLDRKSFWRKLKRYGLDAGEFRGEEREA